MGDVTPTAVSLVPAVDPRIRLGSRWTLMTCLSVILGLFLCISSATYAQVPYTQPCSVSATGWTSGGATVAQYPSGSSASPLGAIASPDGNPYCVISFVPTAPYPVTMGWFRQTPNASNNDFIAGPPYPAYPGPFTQSVTVYIPVTGPGAWTPPANTTEYALGLGMNPNVVYPSNAQTYMESYPNLTVVTPGTVQVGYANYWGAAPMWSPVEALIRQNGWYTFATTYLRTGNQTTDPAVQVSEVLSPGGMLMGYEVGYGTYYAADIQSSDLYGPDEVILESYQPGFAGNNLGVTQVHTYLGFPNPTKSPVVSNSGNVEATVGTAVSYQITASLAPTGYQALQLPPGLSVNATSGLIFGTPTAAGTYPVILAAANASGVGVATVDFVVFTGPPSVSATFVKLDTTTEGRWIGVYGSNGYFVSQDANIQSPSYAAVSFASQGNYIWADPSTSTNALQEPEAPATRIAGTWFTEFHTYFTI